MSNKKSCEGLCDKFKSGICHNYCMLSKEQRKKVSERFALKNTIKNKMGSPL